MKLYTINTSNPPSGSTRSLIYTAIERKIQKTGQYYYPLSQIYKITEISLLIKDRRISKNTIQSQISKMVKTGNLISIP